MNEDNWFEKAGREVENSQKAQQARARAERAEAGRRERERLEKQEIQAKRLASRERAREAEVARAAFDAVAKGRIPVAGPASWGLPPTGSIRTGASLTNDLLERMGQGRPTSGGYHRPKPTPTEGLDAIIEEVAGAGDADAVLKKGGEWIAKITNAISDVIKQAEQDEVSETKPKTTKWTNSY